MESLTPSALSWRSTPVTASPSCSRALSVSSSSSLAGAIPDATKASSTCCCTTPRWNCRADRFTAMISSGCPASCHCRSCSAAVLSTQPPRAATRPLSSASGMNTAGGTDPSSGSSQRHSASQPTIRPLASSTRGWYSSRSALDSMARRRADSICSRSRAASFMAALAKW